MASSTTTRSSGERSAQTAEPHSRPTSRSAPEPRTPTTRPTESTTATTAACRSSAASRIPAWSDNSNSTGTNPNGALAQARHLHGGSQAVSKRGGLRAAPPQISRGRNFRQSSLARARRKRPPMRRAKRLPALRRRMAGDAGRVRASRRVGCGRTLVLSRWGGRTRPKAAHQVPDRLSGSRAIRASTRPLSLLPVTGEA